jgi:hypothetical protein
MIAYILNLLDMIITLYVLNHGATELNPIANNLIILHPLLFIFYKTVVVGAFCWFLSYRKRCGNTKLDLIGLDLCQLVYFLIVLWHVLNLAIAGLV